MEGCSSAPEENYFSLKRSQKVELDMASAAIVR